MERSRSRQVAALGLAVAVVSGCESRPNRNHAQDDDEPSKSSAPRATPSGPEVERAALQRALKESAEHPHLTKAEWSTNSLLLDVDPLATPERHRPPSVRMGATNVHGRLPPEVIQRIVRQNFGRFRLCYENGLRSNPSLAGRVTIDFTIEADGSVKTAKGSGDLPDAGVIACITRAFNGLSFPKPDGGVVTVSYPIAFAPGDPITWKIDGKTLGTVAGDDIKAALEKAGCTTVVRAEPTPGAPTTFTAKLGGKVVTITFFSSSDVAPGPLVIAALEAKAAVFHEGAFVLAIELDGDADKSKAKDLLDKIVKRS